MTDPQERDLTDALTSRLETSVRGFGESLDTIKADLEVAEMTEGPTKKIIREEIVMLSHIRKLLEISSERLRATLSEHYGLPS